MFGCYVRVSTIGQNEAGQKAEIEKWLRGNNITDSRWYVDKESGDSLDRSAFAELQQDVFRGHVSCVVVWKLDRLSRSVIDGLNVLADWCDRGTRVVSVTQQLDFNGPLGKRTLNGVATLGYMTRTTDTRSACKTMYFEAERRGA